MVPVHPRGPAPAKDQPYYHLLAENAETNYVAYVSQQNLLLDDSEEPIDHPGIASMFSREDGALSAAARPKELKKKGEPDALPSPC